MAFDKLQSISFLARSNSGQTNDQLPSACTTTSITKEQKMVIGRMLSLTHSHEIPSDVREVTFTLMKLSRYTISVTFYVVEDHKGERYIKGCTMDPGSHTAQLQIAQQVGINGNGQIKNDPRVTKKHLKFMRETKLDELPQLPQWLSGFLWGRFLGTKNLNLIGLRPQTVHRTQILPYWDKYEQKRSSAPIGLLSPAYALEPSASEAELIKKEQAFVQYCDLYGKPLPGEWDFVDNLPSCLSDLKKLPGKLRIAKQFGPGIVQGLSRRVAAKVSLLLASSPKTADGADEVDS